MAAWIRPLVAIVVVAFGFFAGSSRVAAQATPADEAIEQVPPGALGPAIPAEGYLVEEIAGGLYWVTDGLYQAMFLVSGEGVIVVDAPPSLGQNLLNAIASVTDQPVTHVVYSHSHADHIGAAGLFPAEATYVAHAETAGLLTRSNDPNRPVPTETFTDTMTLTVGDQTLQLDYHGNNHQPGNIFIYAPAQRVLMLVDIIFPGWAPFQDLALAEDVPGFVAAHDFALEYDFDTFIGGHLTRLGTREDVETQRAFVLDLRANAATALQTVDFVAIAQGLGPDAANIWLLFDTYLDAVAAECERLTLATWNGQLGGLEVYTFSHCWQMVESLRVD